MSLFNFHVQEETEDDYGYEPDRAPRDRWKVTLPHQCDSWTITADDYYDTSPDHANAVQRMRLFINEAQAALTALENRQETK